MDEFAYFMIRLRRPSPEAPAAGASGMVERLDTGEKWSFDGTDELLRLMRVVPHPSAKMRPSADPDKAG